MTGAKLTSLPKASRVAETILAFKGITESPVKPSSGKSWKALYSSRVGSLSSIPKNKVSGPLVIVSEKNIISLFKIRHLR